MSKSYTDRCSDYNELKRVYLFSCFLLSSIINSNIIMELFLDRINSVEK